MTILRRSFFTLIEMLVVLLILSTGLALTGVKIKQAFDEQRKLSDFQQVLNMLIMAQDLMLMMDADVEVVFSHDPKTKLVVCRMYVEKLMEESWNKVVEKPLQLAVLRSYEFSTIHDNPLRLRFSLGKMSQGILTLSTDPHISSNTQSKNEMMILLKGYPSPITKLTDSDSVSDYTSSNEQLYPNEVYEKVHDKKNV